MHATLRQYEGIDNPTEIIRLISETFLPDQRTIPGFVSYYFDDVGEAGGRMISLSIFSSQEGGPSQIVVQQSGLPNIRT